MWWTKKPYRVIVPGIEGEWPTQVKYMDHDGVLRGTFRVVIPIMARIATAHLHAELWHSNRFLTVCRVDPIAALYLVPGDTLIVNGEVTIRW